MAEVGLVLVAHGPLAYALRESAEMIVGLQTNTIALSLDTDESLESLTAQIATAVERANRGAGVLLLVDLFGGTPSNAATLSMNKYSTEVVTGMNLGMVLEVVSQRDGKTLAELADVAERAGRASVVTVGRRLKRRVGAS